MKHKGQISQVFVFLMALLVIGAIVLIATKSLGGLLGDKCNVDQINFKHDIEELIAANNDYGAINEVSISAPCQYTTLCLIDTATLLSSVESNNLKNNFSQNNVNKSKFFVMGNSVGSQVRNNVFLISGDGKITLDAGYIPQLLVSGGYVCVDAPSGKFKLRTEGKGRTTLVSDPKNE